MPWLFEHHETSEDNSQRSQHRWTSKVPVVSVVRSRPFRSVYLRRGVGKLRGHPVPGDASDDSGLVTHPKMRSPPADLLGIIDALSCICTPCSPKRASEHSCCRHRRVPPVSCNTSGSFQILPPSENGYGTFQVPQVLSDVFNSFGSIGTSENVLLLSPPLQHH